MKEQRNYLIAKIWSCFCNNYPSIKHVVGYMAEQSEADCYDRRRLLSLFAEIHHRYGYHGAMNHFFLELSTPLQQSLVDYAIRVYAPRELHLAEDEKEMLGI